MSDGILRHTPSLTGLIQSRIISCDPALFPHIGDAITILAEDSQWLEKGDSVADITLAAWDAITSFYGDALIGSISLFLKTVPDQWLALDGSTYSEADYPELYAALDPAFLNVPAQTFTLPDMRDLFVVGAGSTYSLGQSGGSASHTLTVNEMPGHSHTYTPPLVDLDLEAPGAPDVAAARLGAPTQTSSSGGGQAHENRPPFLAIVYGIFAGR